MCVFPPTYFVQIVQSKSACCMYSTCPNVWGEEGGQVGQDGQYLKQYTLLKECELLLMGTLSTSEHLVAEAVLASTE